MSYKEISAKDIPGNIIKMICDQWMLVTAGTPESFNTMTASWGGMGEMWMHEVAVTVIRPQRYTYEFIKNSKHFTLSFFSDEYRKTLAYCGANSGRNVDKIAMTDLTPMEINNCVSFKESNLVLLCETLYTDVVKEDCFTDKSVPESVYENKDFHHIFVGKILKVLIKE